MVNTNTQTHTSLWFICFYSDPEFCWNQWRLYMENR